MIQSPASLEALAHCRASTEECHRRAVVRVIGAMRERLDRELTLDQMADLALMSPFHFNRVFHQLTGIPPGQFLCALRIERARHLLLTTDRSVTDLCFEVGYNSLGTFTTRFTQLVGIAPGQLRRLASEVTLEHIGELLAELASQPPGEDPIPGRVEASRPVAGPIFLGLFERPIPQERPQACAVLTGPGPFRLRNPGDGRYHLFAAALSCAAPSPGSLLGDAAVAAVGGAGPVTVDGRRVEGSTHLRLAPADPLDPPLLVSLPLLLHERLAAEVQPALHGA